jgi:hypothetical protein
MGEERQLTVEEAGLMRPFLKPETPAEEPVLQATDTLAAIDQIFSKNRNKKPATVSAVSRYVDLSYIPPTSNHVERLFSSVKLLLGDLRGRLTDAHLEATVFLKENRKYWHQGMVDELVARSVD